ncbi:MAG: hypothetical protein MUF10_03355 [Thermoanaerobaculaceae bacterium]|jgi:hypothetical protein|nr:hypothetical protein [Thermoanaerobaculaceae bacterium]
MHPDTREGGWQLLDPRPAWDGTWTHDCYVAFSWTGPGERRRVVAVNYSGHQSQSHLALPWSDLAG